MIFKSRQLTLREELTQDFKKEWFNKRNHIIKIRGRGSMSYKQKVILFDENDVIFVPKNTSVFLSANPLDTNKISITLYKPFPFKIEATELIAKHFSAYEELSCMNLRNKEFLLRTLEYYVDTKTIDIQTDNVLSRPSYESVLLIIRADLKYSWSINDVCEQLFISRATLYRLLKKQGLSFVEMLSHERLCNAKRLLLNSQISIDRIAYECGFKSSSYFGKKFRSHFGSMPSQYRKLKHKNE